MTRFGKADTGRIFVRSFAGTPDRGVDVLLKDAVETLIIRAEEDWKRDNLQSFSAQQRISIHVPLTSLKNCTDNSKPPRAGLTDNRSKSGTPFRI